ncbi:MAG: N-6 DNA methylase [Syntrophales bacterium]|nr:N-6 DNA methylase [Syntrophales bacterium]
MLDTETKSRIDSARDILVGKVPDPKSQVEQITIALIYKFMDDMDRQSEELGGKATFFTGDFKKYRWANLLDKRLGGHERLLLYAEGIEKMNENRNIPQLFRDIFKGVFLPYRDPETLNLFLKEIAGFSYDHSERLGDAFEYLLSVLGTQGDAGQFRTPRYVIDFIVAVVDPKKHETVLDPACGTAGFLVSAFKHILINNENLTPDERARLMTNFRGYDIAPDMVRLSRANLYLHGFPNPVIHEYDTLTSEERWDERCDVILANPPFMSPKGGIRPHNRFSIKAKRSEVLFVDYMAEHLNSGGRAGIIVPEGIIFQGQNAYKALRKMLVENYLWAVVSLPAGVFNPYSGVKTSILFLDRNLARRTDEVLFVKVESDGFELGAQRRPNGKNDLPEAFEILDGHKKEQKTQESKLALTISRKRLLESPHIILSGDRYRKAVAVQSKWPMVKLGDARFFTIESGGTPSSTVPEYWGGDIRWVTLVDLPQGESFTEIKNTQRTISETGLKNSSAVLLPKRTVLVSSRATIGRIGLALEPMATNQGFKNIVIDDFDQVNERYVAYAVARLVPVMDQMASGGTFKEISKTSFSHLEIPLPPLSIQQQMVAELEGYRKIIEGARQILANYKPTIKIDPTWSIKPLADIASLEYGLTASAKDEGHARFIRITDITQDGRLSESAVKFVDLNDEAKPYLLMRNDVLVARTGATYGKTLLFDSNETAVFASYLIRIRLTTAVLPGYYWAFAQTDAYWAQAKSLVTGGGQPQFNGNALKNVSVPLPPIDIQHRIVAELEVERALVEANRKLIEVFEKKIQEKLAEVWGEG